jgi:hypothetical protein
MITDHDTPKTRVTMEDECPPAPATHMTSEKCGTVAVSSPEGSAECLSPADTYHAREMHVTVHRRLGESRSTERGRRQRQRGHDMVGLEVKADRQR